MEESYEGRSKEPFDASRIEHVSCTVAWTGYIGSVVAFLVLSGIGAALGYFLNVMLGVVIALIALAIFAFNLLFIRSVHLYTDEDGVWVYSGILPWSKGVSGVKWRDLEDATYTTGFISWICRSYRVRIGHRFTKSSEIICQHIARGDQAVMQINRLHKHFISGMT